MTLSVYDKENFLSFSYIDLWWPMAAPISFVKFILLKWLMLFYQLLFIDTQYIFAPIVVPSVAGRWQHLCFECRTILRQEDPYENKLSF